MVGTCHAGLVDVIIVGGGPAGLSAALLLARSRRRVVVLDAGVKRNEAVSEQHAVLGADGYEREKFLAQARDQVLTYPTAQFHYAEVVDVKVAPEDGNTNGTMSTAKGEPVKECQKTKHFDVLTADGGCWRGRKLILATGVKDLLPEVEGFKELYGRGVYVCLYCEGYEYRDQPMAVYGNCERGVHLALEMLPLSNDITLLTDGEELTASDKERQLLKRHGVRVVKGRIARAFSDRGGCLAGVVLEDGEEIKLKSIFFNTGRRQRSELPARMGLQLDDRNDIICDVGCGRVPNIHGLFVAGNNSQAPLQLIMTAASQGAIVGKTINSELMYEDLGLKVGGTSTQAATYLDGERLEMREDGRREAAGKGGAQRAGRLERWRHVEAEE